MLFRSANDCPGGYVCASGQSVEGKPVQQCVRAPDSTGSSQPGLCPCSPAASAAKLATSCSVQTVDAGGKVTSSCPGNRVCGESGLSPCQATAAAKETCNGVDDDCNGKIDDLACDDQNPCTSDLCKPSQGGCSHLNIEALCDADGNLCTVGDKCVDGTCMPGKPKECAIPNCMVGGCDPAKGCVLTPDDGAPCDDGNPCTMADACAAGECVGKGKQCTSTNPCVKASCDPAKQACAFTPKPEGASCDDGQACSVGDTCKGGSCIGAPMACDDGNPCTTDACTAGTCSHTPVPEGAPCAGDAAFID